MNRNGAALVITLGISQAAGPWALGQFPASSPVYPPQKVDSSARVISWPSRPWADSLVRSGAPTLTTIQFLVDSSGRWEQGKVWLVFGWRLGQQGLQPLVEDLLSRATFSPAIVAGHPERALVQMTVDLASGEYNQAKSLPDTVAHYGVFADTPPEYVSGPRLIYPEDLRRSMVQGEVILEYEVGIDGVPDSASIRVLASAHPLFTVEALRLIRGIRYKPATVNGRPIRVIVRQPVRFQITRSR